MNAGSFPWETQLSSPGSWFQCAGSIWYCQGSLSWTWWQLVSGMHPAPFGISGGGFPLRATGPWTPMPALFSGKQNSAAQVPGVSVQEAFGTVKPARVGHGGTLGLGHIPYCVEFQEAAAHWGPQAPELQCQPFSLLNHTQQPRSLMSACRRCLGLSKQPLKCHFFLHSMSSTAQRSSSGSLGTAVLVALMALQCSGIRRTLLVCLSSFSSVRMAGPQL